MKLMTYKEAAVALGVTRRTLQNWVAEGSITIEQQTFDGTVLLSESELRRVRREKALRNIPLQRRARKLRSQIEAETGEKPWTRKEMRP